MTVHLGRSDGVLIIRLDRPEALNAIDRATSDALLGALDVLESEDALGAAVLTGTGRAFCAGSDLKEIGSAPAFVDGLSHGNVSRVTRRVAGKPVVAAVNGLAHGGGMELVLACDLAVAGPTATFALPEVRHGLVAAAGGLVLGPRQVPRKVLADLLLTGEPIDAERAHALGVVSRVVADPVAEATRVARLVATHPRSAVAAVRDVLPHALDAPERGRLSAWDLVEPTVLAALAARRHSGRGRSHDVD